jgi:hypothetical protein
MSDWHLYWVESDGIEDCFVVAKNSRSACKVEREMNGFDPDDVSATRILKIPQHIAYQFTFPKGKGKAKYVWPWYVSLFDLISRIVRNAFRSSYYASIDFGMKYMIGKEVKVPKRKHVLPLNKKRKLICLLLSLSQKWMLFSFLIKGGCACEKKLLK